MVFGTKLLLQPMTGMNRIEKCGFSLQLCVMVTIKIVLWPTKSYESFYCYRGHHLVGYFLFSYFILRWMAEMFQLFGT